MMGKNKHESGIEIIPIQRNFKMDMPYMSDPTLVPRVQKYLESNVNETYVDINVMADNLQRSYREYARLKRNSFRTSVKKAYSIVLQSYGLEDQDNSTSEDDDSNSSAPEEALRIQNTTTPLSNQIINLYSKPSLPKRMDENELIDISSDDSDAATLPNNIKASNGASTSHENKEPLPSLKLPEVSHKKHNRKVVNPKSERHAAAIGKKRKLDAFGLTPFQSASKRKKSVATLQEPTVSFKDIGGIDHILEDICKLLIHVRHPEVYKQIGISPPRGFLLHGPPGCGKTLLANAIAGEISVPLLKVAAPELVAGVSGESEERIRELFERAACSAPCILFIDEIDAITPSRQNAQKEMERRIVAQLLSCLDDLGQTENGDRVLIIGATNRPDAIDSALRRAGRFDREICLGIPNIQSRVQILKVLTAKLRLDAVFDFENLARLTPGFVGADLMSLTREAAMVAVNRLFATLNETQAQAKLQPEVKKVEVPEANKSVVSDDSEIIVDVDSTKADDVVVNDKEGILVIDEDPKETVPVVLEPVVVADAQAQIVDCKPALKTDALSDLLALLHNQNPLPDEVLSSLCITGDDFKRALKFVQPSAKREGFATVPDVSWEDVGSLTGIREELQMAILAPLRHSREFKLLGLTNPTGILLCGPPGCGKTLIAKAVANEAGINFISVKGPELLNMYVGESERAVRVCFERARNSAPCVIFFDELDAICPKRSDNREGGATMRVVNQMLTEMDGVEAREGVYVLAASNRPDIIDPAVLRPGRLDKILFVGLPSPSERVDILTAITKNGTKPQFAPDVDLKVVGASEKCEGYSGADLAALIKEAGIVALKQYILSGDLQQTLFVNAEHISTAISKIRPSVSEKDRKHYEKLRKMYASIPEQNEVEEMEYS